MTPHFLTVREAARLTGKSISSIRRIIYPIVEDDQHPDRSQIDPSAEEVRTLHAAGTAFPWRLTEDLLRRAIPDATAASTHSADSPHRAIGGDAQSELLAMLRRELDIKNQQILQQSDLNAKQAELLAGLGERIRESNILIGSLQKHLSLTDGRDQTIIQPPKSRLAAKPEKGSGSSARSGKAKRGLFSRLFRP